MMNLFSFTMVVLFIHVNTSFADASDVIVLTTHNFDQEVMHEELMLVEFYAPWCGHCKALEPEYDIAAKELLDAEPPIKLGKLDATEHREIGARFNVGGYPTLKVFRNGKDVPYTGARKAPGIVSYMKKQVGPDARLLTTIAEVEAFKNVDPDLNFSVVGFFTDRQSRLRSSFTLLAPKMRDSFVFAKVTDPEIIKHYKIDTEAIVAFKSFKEDKKDKMSIYTKDLPTTTSRLEAWIVSESFPKVGIYTEKNAERYHSKGLPVMKYFTAIGSKGLSSKHAKYFVNRLMNTAESLRGKLLVAAAEAKDFDEVLTNYHHEKDSKDGLLIIESRDGGKFKFDETFSMENVLAWAQRVLDKKEAVYVKSGKVPADNDTAAVKTVVSTNFEVIAEDESKAVFIEFYAPWCGHCKALEPKWEELGQKYKSFDNLTIAKIDSTANEYDREKWKVEGFPTIYFRAAKNGAKPVKYEGPREVKDMAKFLKKKGIKKGGKKEEKKVDVKVDDKQKEAQKDMKVKNNDLTTEVQELKEQLADCHTVALDAEKKIAKLEKEKALLMKKMQEKMKK